MIFQKHFYGPINNLPGSFSDAEQWLTVAFATIIKEQLNAAHAKILREEYMPVERNSSSIGNLPNGEAYFKLCLKELIITKKSFEIYNTRLNKVKRIRAEMDSKEK